jgi:protein-tyrosine-phosphatase
MILKNRKPTYSILFVCSGNSCRSPMAEGIMKQMLYPKFGNKVKVLSAGTLGIDNNPATISAIKVAQENNIDISRHLSRGLKKNLVESADIIFVMENHHKEFVEQNYPNYRENVFLLKSFANDQNSSISTNIKDPIGQSINVYRQVFDEIEQELNRIYPQIDRLIQIKQSEEE